MTALLLTQDSSRGRTGSHAQRALDIPYTKYMDPAQRNTLLDRAVSVGADSVRTVAPWDHLEPSADDAYSWNFMDSFVAEARTRGLEVHIQISATPDWVHPELVGSVPDRSSRVWYPPRGSAEVGYWHDFVKDLVARYGTRVSTYEIWNEPNHPSFWRGGSGPDPAEYAAVLRAGYLGAKQANPNVTVIGGALSQNDIGYMEHLYTEVGRYPDAAANDEFFDAFGVHPYAVKGGEPLAPGADPATATRASTWGSKNSAFLGIDYVRQVLEAHGDAHKRIWLGEFGYNIRSSWMSPTSDARRAEWLKRAYALLDERPYVMGMCWYSFFGGTDSGFNLYERTTGQETLTLQAFKQVASGDTASPPPDAETLRFSPKADARVDEARGRKNYGTSGTLIADGGVGQAEVSYLKFDVSELNGRQIQSAALRVFVEDGGGSNDGPGVQRAGKTWSEGKMTWRSRPSSKSGIVADKSVVPGGAWVDFDVTSLVTQDGTVTLAVVPTSEDGTYMSSREGPNEPQLIVNVDSGGTASP